MDRGHQSYEAPCPGAKEELQWWISYLEAKAADSRARGSDRVRCLPHRLGGGMPRGQNRGTVVSRGDSVPHQLLRNSSSLPGNQNIPEGQEGHISPPPDRQYHSVAYINHQGGTVSPMATEIAKDLWMWCLERDITIKAQYLLGVENVRADSESRVMQDRSDWMLNPQIFQAIQAQLGPVDLDLFASRLTAQLPQYFSWRPDPSALAMDALLQNWEGLRAYANPPWILLGRALAKVQREQVEIVLMIAPVWPTQPWYPSLLGLLIDYPRLIPQGENTLWGTPQSPVPAVVPQLAVWPISSRDIAQRAFQQELENCSWRHGGQNQPSRTILCSSNGLAGVRSGIQIPFLDL